MTAMFTEVAAIDGVTLISPYDPMPVKRINEDGTLNSEVIPDAMRKAILQSGQLSHLSQSIEKEPEYHHAPPAKGRKKK